MCTDWQSIKVFACSWKVLETKMCAVPWYLMINAGHRDILKWLLMRNSFPFPVPSGKVDNFMIKIFLWVRTIGNVNDQTSVKNKNKFSQEILVKFGKRTLSLFE